MALGSRWYWALVVALFFVLGFFSFSQLTESPPTWFDEGIYLQVAENVTVHGAQEIQIAPQQFVSSAFVTGGYPFLEPISWSFSLFGVSLLHARLVMVGFIFLATLAYFSLIYSLYGALPALLSLLLLVTFPPLYGQGKNALGEVPGLFFLGCFLLSLYRIEKNNYRGTLLYIAAGVAAGLCVSTKPIFLLLGGAVALSVLLYRRSITFYWKPIAAGAIAFCIPVFVWLTLQFWGSDSASTILGYYANPYDIQNLNAEILTNALRFFHESSPLYFLLLMAAWILSFGIRMRQRAKITLTESVVFIFSILVWIAYLRTAGWYRYFFIAEIPALIMLPYAGSSIAARILKTNTQFMRNVLVVCAVLLLVLVQTYQLFFGSWVASHSTETSTNDMTAYMASLPSGSSFFIDNAPEAVVFLPDQTYYQYLQAAPSLLFGASELPILAAGIPDYVIADNAAALADTSSSLSHYGVAVPVGRFLIASRVSAASSK